MSRLKDLLEGLQIKVVVIVENEFTGVNSKEALSRMLLMNSVSFDLLLDELKTLNSNLANELNKLKQSFGRLKNHDINLIEQLVSVGELEEYLKQTKQELNGFEKVNSVFNKEYNNVKNLFLKYGICKAPVIYTEILKIIDVKYVKVIYDDCPVPNNYNDFYKVLKKGMEKTKSRFCLAVIDKVFGESNINDGEEFVRYLTANQKKRKTPLLSFILTSNINGNAELPVERDDYFVREISKNSYDVLGTIEDYIAQCAGAILFDNYKVSIQNGAETAFKTSMRNELVISKILSKAAGEGMSPYDALNNWYQLSTQFYAEKEFLKDIQYTVALSQFYNSKEGDTPNSKIVNPSESNELSEISKFEVFDFNVNKKYLPINNGDIFKYNNKYYLLIGQQCDLSLRLNNKRNYSLAEFIELDVSNSQEPKTKNKRLSNYKKISVDMNDRGSKRIHIQKFDFNGKKRIIIQLSQSRFYYLDFRILDICMTNIDGLSKLVKENESINLNLLPANKQGYFAEIRKQLIEIESDEGLKSKMTELENNYLIKLTSFENNDNKFSYPIQRIARMKPKFMNFIFEEITDYKSRVGLDFFEV